MPQGPWILCSTANDADCKEGRHTPSTPSLVELFAMGPVQLSCPHKVAEAWFAKPGFCKHDIVVSLS